MAKENNEFVDRIPEKESYIFYYGWYVWLSTLNVKTQLKAFKAVCEYALYDIQLPRDGFTLQEYTTLLTFKKNIDANKRNYVNGMKGGSHGSKGGRPKAQETNADCLAKTPPGFSDKNTGGISSANGVNVDEKGEEKGKENADVGCDVTSQVAWVPPTYEYIYTNLFYIFFFKNCNACYEIKRFYKHYSLAEWRLSGGERLDTFRRLQVAAERWKVEDDKPFFPSQFINVWSDVYSMAPEHLKKYLLEISAISRSQTGITIVCNSEAYKWLMSPEINRRIVKLTQTKISQSYRLEILSKKTPSTDFGAKG
jgi:hypothetical protein